MSAHKVCLKHTFAALELREESEFLYGGHRLLESKAGAVERRAGVAAAVSFNLHPLGRIGFAAAICCGQRGRSVGNLLIVGAGGEHCAAKGDEAKGKYVIKVFHDNVDIFFSRRADE